MLRVACDDNDIKELEINEKTFEEQKINWTHTTTKCLNPKKIKVQKEKKN